MLTWIPTFQQFQEMFANDHCLKILMVIHQQSQNNIFPCAADIAKILNIHISTVSKYLDLLSKNNFVEKEQFSNKPGKPTYYKFQLPSVSITLDFPNLTSQLDEVVGDDSLSNPLIRELPNLSPRVIYNFNEDGIITSFVVQQKTKAKRTIKRKIILSSQESNFMKFLPHPTMEFGSFLDICDYAGITDVISLKNLQFFLDKLIKYNIIELQAPKV